MIESSIKCLYWNDLHIHLPQPVFFHDKQFIRFDLSGSREYIEPGADI